MGLKCAWFEVGRTWRCFLGKLDRCTQCNKEDGKDMDVLGLVGFRQGRRGPKWNLSFGAEKIVSCES